MNKIGLKKNSLFGTEVKQQQDTIENFCAKINAGKQVLKTKEFMIIARIESLILEKGLDDALKRAFAYVKAGADGIMIHSKIIYGSIVKKIKKTKNKVNGGIVV